MKRSEIRRESVERGEIAIGGPDSCSGFNCVRIYGIGNFGEGDHTVSWMTALSNDGFFESTAEIQIGI